MTVEAPARQGLADEVRRPSLLVTGGLAFMGLALMFPRLWVGIGPLSLPLLVASALGWVGWHRMPSWRTLRVHLLLGGLFAAWLVLSAIAVWQGRALYLSVATGLWFVFIIPGVANLIRSETHRRALILGLAIALAVYATTMVGRVVSGSSVYDPDAIGAGLIFGSKRNLVNARLLFVIPLLVWGSLQWRKGLRWGLALLGAAAIIVSGGRSGLMGLAVIGLLYVVLVPSSGQRARAAATLTLAAILAVIAIGEFGGQATVGTDRLTAFIRGERTSSDDHRELQLDRAWQVALDNPVFGIGYDGLPGLDHPSLRQARNERERRSAQEGGVHNTYAQVLAEFGFPALTLFLLLQAALFRAAYRARRDGRVRAATCSMAAVSMMLMFHPASIDLLQFAIILLVAGTGPPPAEPAGSRGVTTTTTRRPHR